MLKKENEHECDFKQSDKMQDVVMDCQGNAYCARCRKQLSLDQIHPDVFKRKR